MRGAAVVADHAQHVRGVLLVAGEGAELARHLGRGLVGDAGHDSGQRAAERAAFLAVVGQAHGHQEAADIGEAEAQRAELVGELGDRLARGTAPSSRRFRARRSRAGRDAHRPRRRTMLGRGVVEREQVGGGEVARRVVQEHVFRARIGGADVAGRLAGVPVVHGGVEVQAGIGRGPGGVADLFPEVAGLQRLRHLLVGAADQVPVAVGFDRAQEIVLQRDRVVGVLAGDGEIGFRIPVGVVDVELRCPCSPAWRTGSPA